MRLLFKLHLNRLSRTKSTFTRANININFPPKTARIGFWNSVYRKHIHHAYKKTSKHVFESSSTFTLPYSHRIKQHSLETTESQRRNPKKEKNHSKTTINSTLKRPTKFRHTTPSIIIIIKCSIFTCFLNGKLQGWCLPGWRRACCSATKTFLSGLFFLIRFCSLFP